MRVIQAAPPPDPPDAQPARTAAKASWMAILIPVPVRLAIQTSVRDAGADAWMLGLVSAAVTIGCVLVGLAAGVYALTQVRRVGSKGVLTPALIGTVVNAALFAIMVYAFQVGMRNR
jgi:hypothetical protein